MELELRGITMATIFQQNLNSATTSAIKYRGIPLDRGYFDWQCDKGVSGPRKSVGRYIVDIPKHSAVARTVGRRRSQHARTD